MVRMFPGASDIKLLKGYKLRRFEPFKCLKKVEKSTIHREREKKFITHPLVRFFSKQSKIFFILVYIFLFFYYYCSVILFFFFFVQAVDITAFTNECRAKVSSKQSPFFSLLSPLLCGTVFFPLVSLVNALQVPSYGGWIWVFLLIKREQGTPLYHPGLFIVWKSSGLHFSSCTCTDDWFCG